LKAVIHEAAIKGWLDANTVRKLNAEMVGRRGARTLRSLVAERDMSKGWSRSKLETAFAALVRDAGLPRYVRGSYVDIGAGDVRECDAVWREQKVMVELDFLPIHETGFVPYRDRRRDRRLTASDWKVFRITPLDLAEYRAEVVEDLRKALGLTEMHEARE
jgi:very-short-patch-repair endonuclease